MCELIRQNIDHVSFWVRVVSAFEVADGKKIDKICDAFVAGKINNKADLYNEVRRLSKRFTSDHSIRRWEQITEKFEFIIDENCRFAEQLRAM
jgi:hypothetical protein